MYFCVVLCIFFVTFSVLFACVCVLNNCHRVATRLQLTDIISYHIISYHIISYRIISYLCFSNYFLHFPQLTSNFYQNYPFLLLFLPFQQFFLLCLPFLPSLSLLSSFCFGFNFLRSSSPPLLFLFRISVTTQGTANSPHSSPHKTAHNGLYAPHHHAFRNQTFA